MHKESLYLLNFCEINIFFNKTKPKKTLIRKGIFVMKTIQISNNNTILKLLNSNLKYEVIHDGFSWIGQGRKPFYLLLT